MHTFFSLPATALSSLPLSHLSLFPPSTSLSPTQLFYHYNKVQQLKALYDEILRPEFLEDHPPLTTGDIPPGREKGKAATGGGGGKKEKEKKGSEGKEKKGKGVHKESVHEVAG